MKDIIVWKMVQKSSLGYVEEDGREDGGHVEGELANKYKS